MQELIKLIYKNKSENIGEIFNYIEESLKNGNVKEISDLIAELDFVKLKGSMRLAILRSSFRARKHINNYTILLEDTKNYFQFKDIDYTRRMRGLI